MSNGFRIKSAQKRRSPSPSMRPRELRRDESTRISADALRERLIVAQQRGRDEELWHAWVKANLAACAEKLGLEADPASAKAEFWELWDAVAGAGAYYDPLNHCFTAFDPALDPVPSTLHQVFRPAPSGDLVQVADTTRRLPRIVPQILSETTKKNRCTVEVLETHLARRVGGARANRVVVLPVVEEGAPSVPEVGAEGAEVVVLPEARDADTCNDALDKALRDREGNIDLIVFVFGLAEKGRRSDGGPRPALTVPRDVVPWLPWLLSAEAIVTTPMHVEQLDGVGVGARDAWDVRASLIARSANMLGGVLRSDGVEAERVQRYARHGDKGGGMTRVRGGLDGMPGIHRVPTAGECAIHNPACLHGWFAWSSCSALDAALRYIRPRRVLELGAWLGASSRFIVEHPQRPSVFVAVDYFKHPGVNKHPLRRIAPEDKVIQTFPRFETFAQNMREAVAAVRSRQVSQGSRGEGEGGREVVPGSMPGAETGGREVKSRKRQRPALCKDRRKGEEEEEEKEVVVEEEEKEKEKEECELQPSKRQRRVGMGVGARGTAVEVFMLQTDAHKAPRELARAGFAPEVVYIDCEKKTKALQDLIRAVRRAIPGVTIVGDDNIYPSVQLAIRQLIARGDVPASQVLRREGRDSYVILGDGLDMAGFTRVLEGCDAERDPAVGAEEVTIRVGARKEAESGDAFGTRREESGCGAGEFTFSVSRNGALTSRSVEMLVEEAERQPPSVACQLLEGLARQVDLLAESEGTIARAPLHELCRALQPRTLAKLWGAVARIVEEAPRLHAISFLTPFDFVLHKVRFQL